MKIDPTQGGSASWGEVIEDEHKVTLQRKASIKKVVKAQENERSRRMNPRAHAMYQIVFALSALALAALVALTFEEQVRAIPSQVSAMLSPPPPPPPPPPKFGFF